MSKGSTPKATESEIKLGKLGKEMADVAAQLTGGRDYMEKQATLDKSQRYEEQTLGAVQAADAATTGGGFQAPIESYDQRDRTGIGVSSKARTELEQAEAVGNMAASDLGQSAQATSAETQLGYDAMKVAQAKASYEQAKQAVPFEIAGSIAGGVMAYKKGGGKWFKDTDKPELGKV